MPISNNNEITVRAKCSYEELDEELQLRGFKATNKYNFSDIFLIPREIDIYKESNRKILEKAVLLREANGITSNKKSKKITFKKKVISENGDIVSQSAIKCQIDNIEDAKNLFIAIGYKQLMKTSEVHTSYKKGNLIFIVKEVNQGSILIEVETNDTYKTIEVLKKIIIDLNISVDLSNLFVKKAEEELQKIKDKGEY